MKKLHILACGVLAMSAVMTSCQNEVLDHAKKDTDRQNEYLKAWINKFDVPDPNHDWCMLRAVEADIEISAIGGISAQIYNRAPQQGGHLIGIAEGDTRLVLDLQKNATEVYAIVLDNDGNEISKGTYDVPAASVCIDGNATPAPEGQSRYAHGDDNWFDAMIACEDLGAIGDFDFNDIVLGLRHVAGTSQLYVTPMAAGGTLNATVNFANQTIGEIHSMLNGEGASTTQMLNTTKYSIVGPTIVVDLSRFTSSPSTWSLTTGWHWFTLKITDQEGEDTDAIHIPYNIEATGNGAPQMLCLGGDWYWPTETTSIEVSYPNFKNWTNNSEVTTWCDSNDDISTVVVWGIEKVAPCWFSATTSAGTPYAPKINNASVGNVESGVKYYMMPPGTTQNMFISQTDITTVDVGASHFDMSGVYSADYMFNGCTSLTSLDLSGWNTSNLATAKYFAYGCTNLTSVDMTGWDTSNVYYMNYMFTNNSNLTTFNVGDLDMRKVADASHMFENCENLETLNCSRWNFDGTTYPDLSCMFMKCKKLKSLDLSQWKAKPRDMRRAFSQCDELEYLDVSNLDLTAMPAYGEGSCQMSSVFCCAGIRTLKANNWVIPSSFDVSTTFKSCHKYNFTLEAKNWDCTSRTNEVSYKEIGTMYRLFRNVYDLADIDVTGWQTSGVVAMGKLFEDCHNLVNITGISGWDISSVKYMDGMFYGCEALRTLDLSVWDTSAVTDMSMMFYGCRNLENLYIDNFDMTNVTTMTNMFYGCTDNLHIRCSATTKTWLLENAETIALPTALQDADSPNWL